MNRFQSYDELRQFVIIAQHQSFTAAGEALHLTKGAVSYLVRQLEKELGFALFKRVHNGIMLTEKGAKLWHVARISFSEVEREIFILREANLTAITVGASSYFASRWLSSRLMSFITEYPRIKLQLQPVVGLGDLQSGELDLMIRWGKGEWSDAETELLFRCPAFATAGLAVAQEIEAKGLTAVLPHITLLHDREGSTAWQDWFAAVGLPYHPKQDSLVIPDPNVRVQAVIHGQGIALNDALVQTEIEANQLVQLSSVELPAYGYFLAYSPAALRHPRLLDFRNWIIKEIANETKIVE